MSGKPSIKVGIVGTGNVARNNYLPYLSRQEDVSLVYYTRTRSRAEACAEAFGGRVLGSVREFLAEDPDAVLVLTRETQRFEATMSLLEEGRPKRLFFEKPLVAAQGQANVAEGDFYAARALLSRASEAGAATAMVFNYRFFDQTVRALRIVRERQWGKLVQASLWVNYACWSHCIDLLHVFGGRVAQVSALAGEAVHGTGAQRGVDVTAAFRLKNGGTGTILGTSGSDFDLWLYEMLLRFEGGILRLNDLDGPLDVLDNERRYSETHTLIGNHSRWEQYKASFEKSLAAYLDSIRQGQPPPVPGLAGLEELQFEAALRRSIAEQRPVGVQAEFPLGLGVERGRAG
jgi:predicted dehydrogenase